MHHFSVWAPFADRVDLVVDGRSEPMAPDADRPAFEPGWWAVDLAEAGAGMAYRFSVDGGPPRPDPRSAFQPEGVEGPSVVVDHQAFDWHDGDWRGFELSTSVLYELHVGTFSAEGTFEGAIDHLDHLVDLGVGAVELMPAAEFSGRRGWGYDGVHWFAPHHAYGGPEALKRFVEAAHRAGLGVVMDVVYNHLGPAGNHLASYGPYFTDRHRTPWGPALNFDGPYSDEVRRMVVDSAAMWLRDYHCDGLRLDAVEAISDASVTHLLGELAGFVDDLARELGRPLHLVAESDRNDPRLLRSRDAGGYGLTACWADEVHHALHATVSGEGFGHYEDFGSLEQLATALRRAWVHTGQWSGFRRRRHGGSPSGLGGGCFVVSLQNHDQVGNRPSGERIGALVPVGVVKAAAALLLLSPFVPLLFQGEEWLASTPFTYFTDHEDRTLAEAVSAGRRAELAALGWDPETVSDPQEPSSFERSVLDWSELGEAPHREVLEWYRELVALRSRLPGLAGGDPGATTTAVDEEHAFLVVTRPECSVAATLGERPVSIPSADGLLLASEDGVAVVDGKLCLPPRSVAVLTPAGGRRSVPGRNAK